MKASIRYFSLLLVLVSSNVWACLPTDGTEVTLTGKVMLDQYQTESRLVKYKSLHLNTNACFQADGEFSTQQQYADRLQLVVPSNISLHPGQEYRMTGQAFHAHTAHHYTNVLFAISSL